MLPRDRWSNSWMVTMPNGDVIETFHESTAEASQRAGLKVQTAYQYLIEFNRSLKESKNEASQAK